MKLQYINKDDQMSDLPEVYNNNLAEINKSIDNILAEIQRINDEIYHLKIITRGE